MTPVRPVALLLALATVSVAQTTQPTPDVWQRLVSVDFAEREKAFNELWRQGEAVRERLTAEADTGSVDKRDRCRRLLWRLDLGVTPAMPADALDAVTGYAYAGDQLDKFARLQRLRELAVNGSPVLLKLALSEPDADVRATAFNYSYPKATDAYLSHLTDAASPDAARIAAYAKAFAHVQVDPNVRQLEAGVLLLTGRLDKELAQLRSASGVRPVTDRLRLARLEVAAGHDAEALAVCGRPGPGAEVLAGIELAIRLRQGDPADTLRSLGARSLDGNALVPALAVARRLTGDVDTATAELSTWLAAQDTSQDYARRRVARTLMLAGDPDGGAALFAKLPDGVGVLGLMGRWVEAFSIDDPPADAPQRQAFDDAVLQLKQEAGLRPPDPATTRPARADRGEFPEDLTKAAKAFGERRYADAVAACDRQLATDTPLGNVARYLRASSLAAAGDPAGPREQLNVGLRLCARADVWLDVIDKLDDLGLPALADAESGKLDRCAVDNAWVACTLAVRDARRAAAAKDWATAARAQDRLLLTHLTSQTLQYTEPTGYVRGPYLSSVYHARAAWAAGDRAQAVAYASAAAAYRPSSGTMAIEFVPKLRDAGDSAAADALFERTWAKQQDLCRDYPKAARVRNTAAWTALRCGRHLDEALKLAEQSVALAPGNPASLDTLAEALFRAGRKDEALARIREAVGINPDDPSAKQRLAGFERGEVVLPEEPD